MSAGDLPVLVLAPGRDGELAARVLAGRGQRCKLFESGESLLAHIDEQAGALLLAEETLTDRFAERLVGVLGAQPPWSDLPILLVAHNLHHRSRMPGVAILGNVAVLTRPMAIDALVSSVASALRARRRQFQVRDLLHAQREEARRKDEFLAMLAHELRNPLAPVRFAAHLLGTAELSRKDLRAMASLVGRQVTHMARIVDDLLDVSRLTRGQILLEPTRLDLVELAQAIVGDHGPTAAARGVRLGLRFGAKPVPVHGDRTRLKQVVDNLLDNAIKFSPPGAEVRVEVGVRNGQATLAVVDRGEGIDPQLLPYLFEPFAQADRSLDRRRGGLGLGLTLVRALTRLHGGEVSAESEGPGKGSVFTIRLPHAAARVADDVREDEAGTPKSAALRVLIAEDNRDAAESLRMLLSLNGHEVAVAYTGTDAVEQATRFRPDVVLCDIGLPGIDGYEVARRLRNGGAYRPRRLIAVTGYATEEDRAHAADAGFDGHLRKPVEPSDLLAQIASLASSRAPDAAGRALARGD